MEARAIDTHAHLFLNDFAPDWEGITHRAQEVCEAVLLPNLDTSTVPQLFQLLRSAPTFYYGMIGLHPTHVKANYREELTQLESYLSQGEWVAIGEVGMDLYWDSSTQAWQEEALHTQAKWAIQYDLPLSVHFRNALEPTLEVLKPFLGQVRGVFHCFTGTYEEAVRIIDAGFLLGIGGVITYKNAAPLREAVKKIPLSAMVVETDSPYLAPIPFRGRRNESSYLPYIIRAIAESRGLSPEEVTAATTQTACALFRLPSFSASEGHKAK